MSEALTVQVRPLATAHEVLRLLQPGWTRLDPQSVSGDPTPGLEARVHDPLWLLARQWQFGEFDGDDAGSPLAVTVQSTASAITAWREGGAADDAPARPLPAGEPLDPWIEREPPPAQGPGLRQRAEAGSALVAALAQAGIDARAALLAAHPLPLEGEVPRLFRTLARSCPDGQAAALALEAGTPAWLDGAPAAALEAAAAWLAWWRGSVWPQPSAAPESWLAERLEYRFAIRAGSGGQQRVFNAPLHDGGGIDWFSFDHRPGATLAVPGETAAADPAQRNQTMMATPLRYLGMPADRLWQFEDGAVNLGRLETQVHDLARLSFVEFAMVYGCDWFVVPLDVDSGSFTVIDRLTVTNTFGESVDIGIADDGARSGRFRMFGTSIEGSDDVQHGLLVPPSARGTLEGRALEEVLFLRDEAANMAWAVEKTVQAASGDPRSRGDEPRPDNSPGELLSPAELKYILQTAVPAHWIPLVPVATRAASGAFELRKGTVTEQDESLGSLLDPTPFTLKEEEVPREGVRVRRLPSLTRAADGRYLRWVARSVSVGRGEGSSGLAFDATLRPS